MSATAIDPDDRSTWTIEYLDSLVTWQELRRLKTDALLALIMERGNLDEGHATKILAAARFADRITIREVRLVAPGRYEVVN